MLLFWSEAFISPFHFSTSSHMRKETYFVPPIIMEHAIEAQGSCTLVVCVTQPCSPESAWNSVAFIEASLEELPVRADLGPSCLATKISAPDPSLLGGSATHQSQAQIHPESTGIVRGRCDAVFRFLGLISCWSLLGARPGHHARP